MVLFRPIVLITLCYLLILSACKIGYLPYEQVENSGENPADTLFRHFQALQTSPVTVSMEGEMIRINLSVLKSSDRPSDFKKIRRRFAPNAGLVMENDSSLPKPNRLWMEKVILHDSLYQYNLYFAYSLDTAIQFAKATFYREEQTGKIHAILKYIASYGVPEDIFENISVTTVDFLGRDMNLEPYCRWETAHHLECPGKGRISWSEHPDMASAQKALDIQMRFSRNYQYSLLQHEEVVDVIFEGKSLKAHKMEFTLKESRLIFNLNPQRMIAYYLAAKVNDRYIHAVMSFYKDQAAPGGLPPLIQEVMSLPK